jgi:hypothetical protein
MNKAALVFVLLLSTISAGNPNPDVPGYTVNVHVTTSRMVTRDPHASFYQELSVVIGAKKYELASDGASNTLLALGDYNAKLVKDDHRNAYDSYQVYEFLFSDNKTRKFIVVGQTE